MPIGELFDQTWGLYKRRALTLILIYLAIVLLVLVPVAILTGLGLLIGFSGPVVALLVLLGLLAMPLFATWGGAAFTCAIVDDQLGVGDAFRRGRSLILPFLWVFTLLGFIITGGYLLLIIPGIIFSVWFFFAQYIVVAEDTRGMTALLKSREYVRGFGWAVCGRLLLVMIMGGIIGAIPLIGPFLSIAFTPYFMLWMFLVYQELREIKDAPVFACGNKEKAQWLLRGAAGYALLPLLLLALYGPMLLQMGRNLADGNWPALIMPGMTLPGDTPEYAFPVDETIRPADFPLLLGTWSGTELGGGATWEVTFEQNGHGVLVQEVDGGWLAGNAVIRFDIGERDGAIRVPPGWGVLDVEVTSSSTGGQAGQVALGTFSVHGDQLKFCLGEPGGTVRAEEFAPAYGLRCLELTRTGGTAGVPDYRYPSPSGETAPATPSAPDDTPTGNLSDISVFIYVANYTGGLRVNGREFRTFEGERDMQYNYNSFGDDFFHIGENIIEVDYAPLADLPADHWLLNIHIKISRGGRIVGEWKINERTAGSQAFTLDIPQ